MSVRPTSAVLICLLALFLCAGPVLAAKTAAPPSFHGLTFGTNPAGQAGLTPLRSTGGVDYFFRAPEPFDIPGFEKPTVIYGAFKGRLFGVYVRLGKAETFAALEKTTTAKYGPPRKSVEGRSTVLRWKKGDLKIKLKLDPASGDMKLTYTYVPVAQEVEAAGDMDHTLSNELFDKAMEARQSGPEPLGQAVKVAPVPKPLGPNQKRGYDLFDFSK